MSPNPEIILMTIDFRDTIVVRQSMNKGTKTIDKPIKESNFYDEGFDQKEEKRLKLAGDLMIMSAKGTKKIRLNEMLRKKSTLPKGMTISTEKGTKTRKLE